jgi:L-methionine (R)-S-oxide reductase
VCADAFIGEQTLVVADVHAYPGHIGESNPKRPPRRCLASHDYAHPACDGLSQSEIVVPLRNKSGKVIGVLDLDSTVKGTFDEVDRAGLERIADVLRI